MADFSWAEVTPLVHALPPGRHGAAEGAAGVRLGELTDFALSLVMARRGAWDAAAAAASAAYGVPAPAGPAAVRSDRALLIGSGPGQFLAVTPDARAPGVVGAFAGIASLSDQSDARALLRVAGARARAALAKFCSLDLHPSAFPVAAAAVTSIEHTSVVLWRDEDDADGAVFLILLPTSFAGSIAETVLDSAAEYGVDVEAPRAWRP